MKNVLILAFWICLPYFTFSAVPLPEDSTNHVVQKSGQTPWGADHEIILDEIDIQGTVEKPSVIVVPKRIEPNLQEVELNRSFEKEVKEGVGEIPKSDEILRKVEPVPSIKKSIEKKRD
jgi:hypothetical protein